jgi:acyl carrier protein
MGQPVISESAILQDLIKITEEMTLDWDRRIEGPIGPNTQLVGELQFESIDIVQFIVSIVEHFQRKGLPFETLLMRDGKYVDEIVLEDVAAFLHRHLNYHREE